MRAAVTVGPRQIEIGEIPDPLVPAGYVLVEVDTVGLCGTDLHIWEGSYPSGELPIVQGHEISGRLVAVPPGSQCAAGLGSGVVLDPTTSCRNCHACRIGRGNACASMSVLGVHRPGGLCDRIAVPAHRVHSATDMAADVAALVEPTSISLQAVQRSGAEAGERAVVLGCGSIGLLAVLALRERGTRVAAVDVHADRRQRAGQLGAELCLPAEGRRVPVAALLAWADGDGPSIVIEATGAPEALADAIHVVANAGRIVAVGISAGTAELPMIALPYKELDLLGSRNSNGLFPRAIEFVSRHESAVRSLVTHRFPLERLDDAYSVMADPAAGVCKVIVAVGD